MSIVTVHNIDCEFDGNGNLSEHSDESDVPLYRREYFQNNPSLITFIESVAQHVLRCENIGEKEVAIAVVSEPCMRQYNAQFRGRDSATDVLSFPSSDACIRKTCENTHRMKIAFSTENTPQNFEDADDFHNAFRDFEKADAAFSHEVQRYLGDVLVCCDYVMHQAREYGEVFERELARVIIHGILHLLGYTHTTYDMKCDFMLKKQEHILALFIFPKIEKPA